MALQGSFAAEDGTVYPECYAMYLNTVADKTSCFVAFGLYKDKAARDQDIGSMLVVKSFPFPVEHLEGKVPDIFYNAVKLSEPVFQGWADVLDPVPSPGPAEEVPSV